MARLTPRHDPLLASHDWRLVPLCLWERACSWSEAELALSNDDVERLYREHASEVLRFLARRVLLADVAVDLMAETFAQAYRDRQRFRGDSDEEAVAWVFGIARHCLSGYLRRGAAERRALRRLGVERRALHDFEYDCIEELAELQALVREVRDGFDELDGGQRDALRLRVVEERSYADVARELGVTEEAARARVSRALRALRESRVFSDQRSELDHV
jgi:RNA polymerase sigma-70 factor (ECF subfamily)